MHMPMLHVHVVGAAAAAAGFPHCSQVSHTQSNAVMTEPRAAQKLGFHTMSFLFLTQDVRPQEDVVQQEAHHDDGLSDAAAIEVTVAQTRGRCHGYVQRINVPAVCRLSLLGQIAH